MFQSLLVTGADAQDVLRRCRDELSAYRGRFTLGLVYLSDHLAGDAGGRVEGIRIASGIEHWLGGVAVGVLGTTGDAFDEPAASIMLMDLPLEDVHLFGPVRDTDALDAQVRRFQHEASPLIGLVHVDPRRPEVPAVLSSLAREGSTYLVGGLLSSRGPYAQVGRDMGEGVASGALFASGVTVATRLSQGCSPIGPRRSVTQMQGDLILELDDRPVLDVLVEDLNSDGGGAADIHVALPRLGSDTGDYRVRNLLGVDTDEGTLAVGEHLSAGDVLMFCRRNVQAARRDLERMLDELRRAVPGEVRGGVYVSCLARGPNLFDEPGLEVSLIRERFGDIPLTGFYANGGIAGEEIYGYTGVLTLFL